MNKTVSLVVLACSLYGCATSIDRVGPNLFMAESTYGDAGSIRRANEFCGASNLAVLVTTIVPGTDRSYAKFYFKCLNPNSSEYRAQTRGPSYEPTPNVIIQDNRSR